MMGRLALLVGLGLATVACGNPAARTASASEGPTGPRFHIPADWVEVDRATGDSSSVVSFGPPDLQAGVNVRQYPVLTISTGPQTDAMSIRQLRSAITGFEYDPMAEELPDDADLTVTGYEEIADPDYWGVRITGYSADNHAIDLLGLVDRSDQTVTIASIACTLACYRDNADQIAEIQGSWNIGE